MVYRIEACSGNPLKNLDPFGSDWQVREGKFHSLADAIKRVKQIYDKNQTQVLRVVQVDEEIYPDLFDLCRTASRKEQQ